MRSAVHFIPIATSLVALAFSSELFRRWRERGGAHHAWFCVGALTYAAGTITESYTTLFGWHDLSFRLWYVTGALMGGAPLAQGATYLHVRKSVADLLSTILVVAILVGAVCVFASPIRPELVEPYRLSGKVLGWTWVRAISPFINTYAFVMLVGGALRSAWHYSKQATERHRMVGNIFIAIGALLPGIGGTFTRFGYVEVLYVTEFVGLCLIIAGYRKVIGPPPPQRIASQAMDAISPSA